jgi:hypothetical protein
MTFMVKVIKPPGLKVDQIRLELLNAMRKEGRLQKKRLAETARHWTGAKPTFEFLIGLTGTETALFVGPSGDTKGAQKWVWIDEGTPPHIIRPRNARILAFRVGGRSGSSPNTLAVSAGRRGSKWAHAKVVHHPGIRARNWAITLMKERMNPYYASINAAVKRGYEKASR